VDHLFVTRDAVPVLVELKRAVDTRLRREVVGQMLDYAANATAFWQAGRIADSFASTVEKAGGDPDEVLAAFLGDEDPASFWTQVDTNFSAGRFKLVFVADSIPRELARIVEFMNDQMRADVRAVELRWFSDMTGAVTLSPRVIGETERAAVAKSAVPKLPRISRDQWLAEHIAPAGNEALEGAAAYIRLVEAVGGEADMATRQGSIYAEFSVTKGRPFYPLHLWSEGRLVSLSLRWLQSRPAMASAEVRKEWLDRLVAIVGPTSTTNLTGFPSFRVELLADPSTASRMEAYLADLVAFVRSEPAR
jgi:hypothetical protein